MWEQGCSSLHGYGPIHTQLWPDRKQATSSWWKCEDVLLSCRRGTNANQLASPRWKAGGRGREHLVFWEEEEMRWTAASEKMWDGRGGGRKGFFIKGRSSQRPGRKWISTFHSGEPACQRTGRSLESKGEGWGNIQGACREGQSNGRGAFWKAT